MMRRIRVEENYARENKRKIRKRGKKRQELEEIRTTIKSNKYLIHEEYNNYLQDDTNKGMSNLKAARL